MSDVFRVSVREKGPQGYGGAQWQTMSGRSMEAIFAELAGTLGTTSLASAMEQAAFLICMDIIAQDTAKASLRLVEDTANGTPSVVAPKKHPLARMFKLRPNKRHTWIEYSQMMSYWFGLMSNAYAYVVRNQFGEPLALVPLMPSRVVDMASAATGEVFYEITAGTWQEMALLGFSSRRVPERDVIHVRARLLDGFKGYSTLIAGQKTLATGRAIEEYRDELFGESGQLRGVFKKKDPGAVNDAAFARLRSQFAELMHRFKGNTEPIVLEDGLEFQSISSNPADAELTKQLEAQIVSTCRLLRIPPHKAFHLVNVKYENMEVLEKSYVTDTIEPILKSFEQRYTAALLSEDDQLNGYETNFDRSALELRDPKVLGETTDKLVKAGVITLNQARGRHGYNPIPGGDVRLIPANTLVVDDNNTLVIEPPAAAPPAAGGGEPEPKPKPKLALVS